MTCPSCGPLPSRGALRGFAIVMTLAIAGCASTPSTKRATASASASNVAKPSVQAPARRGGGYYLDDGPGDHPPPDLDLLPDAIPRVEKYASGANRPYNVFGTEYVPDLSGSPYKQRGIGSWYGRKFHGQRTSSGEIYDMYAMTAAHPTLPIPSYALVTNLANGKSIIVRVNDRGPFLHNRIMDLSYAAAYKLGYAGAGSAMIQVEMLLPRDIAAGRIPATSSGLFASASSSSLAADARNETTKPASPPARTQPIAPAEPKLPPAPTLPAAPTPSFAPPNNVSQSPIGVVPATVGNSPLPSIAAASPRSIATAAIAVPASSASRLDADIPPDLIPLPDREPAPALPSTPTASGYYLQLGAFRAKAGADSFASHLSRLIDPMLASRVHVGRARGLWRVRVGPYAQRIDANSAASSVRAAISQPVLVLPDGVGR